MSEGENRTFIFVLLWELAVDDVNFAWRAV